MTMPIRGQKTHGAQTCHDEEAPEEGRSPGSEKITDEAAYTVSGTCCSGCESREGGDGKASETGSIREDGQNADNEARETRSQDAKTGPHRQKPHTTRKSHNVHWGYEGAGGPAHWGGIKQTFRACSAGQSQSPINLEAPEAGHLAPLGIHYKVSLIEMLNNGHTVQANYGKGSYITLGKERYDLVQFHFHTPSEHRVAGRSFPMEIHFVHRNKRGQLAIIGVLATFGDYNLAAREIWDRLPARAHTKSANTRSLINARDLLPDETKYFRYSGSLTAPLCSEKVSWVVLQKPMSFSEAQIAKLHRIIGMNARPTQARNSRYLLQSIGGWTMKIYLFIPILLGGLSACSMQALESLKLPSFMDGKKSATMASATGSGVKEDPMRLDTIAFADAYCRKDGLAAVAATQNLVVAHPKHPRAQLNYGLALDPAGRGVTLTPSSTVLRRATTRCPRFCATETILNIPEL